MLFKRLRPTRQAKSPAGVEHLEDPSATDNTTLYQPLNGTSQFRLLRILPGEYSDVLRCKFQIADLSIKKSLPAYSAISYTWGDSARERDIVLQGHNLEITRSAYDVLHCVRSPKKERVVWIDAISINQDDLVEKGQQIQMMKSIYSASKDTIVHLGPERQDTALAVHFFSVLQKAFPYVESVNTVPEAFVLSLTGTTKASPEWAAAKGMFDRPWFQRLWIAQEVALSNHIEFRCGSHVISWEDFLGVFAALSRLDQPVFALVDCAGYNKFRALCLLRQHYKFDLTCKEMSKLKGEGWIDYPKHLYNHRKMQVVIDQFATFSHVLQMCAGAQATDPRDYVYGILGLARDEVARGFSPDYSKSVEDAFIQFTRHVLSQTSIYDILGTAGIGRERQYSSLPSWVPDYSKSQSPTSIWRFTCSGPASCSAGVSSTPIPNSVRFQDQDLITQAWLVDVVSEVGFWPFSFHKNVWHRYLTEAIEMAGRSPTITQESLCRTLMSDPATGYNSIHSNSNTFSQFSALYSNPKHKGREWYDMSTLIWQARDIPHPTKMQARSYVDVFGPHNRRIGVTQRGYMAQLPPKSAVGDVICLFPGGKVPFVLREISLLRRASPVYELVGDCYIHDLMKGEGIKLASLQEITIR